MSMYRQNNRCVTPPAVPRCGNSGTSFCNMDQTSGVVGVCGGIITTERAEPCDKETFLQGLPVAMAYVPWQSYDNLYPLSQALNRGTLFRELDLDFMGRRCN